MPSATSEARLPIVGIGASAGGLEALREMLAPARAPTGMAFVIVQHLDPNHESLLAQLLDRQTALEVLQSEGGERIEADKVYIIPPGHGLLIRQGVLELTDFAQPRGLRRPIDDFFVSLAADQHANAACVILSGTGADGTTGLRAIKENGGLSIVQDPETARYDGMPVSAVGTGLVDFIKPAGEILDCLVAFFNRRTVGNGGLEKPTLVADHIDELCRTMRAAVGHDFAGYKRTTLKRRIERRMQVLGVNSSEAYLERLKQDRGECDALLRDLLINVTRFFRDADSFEVLRQRAIEPLLNEAGTDELRIWVPGCSSGEEAYSMAMLFAHAAHGREDPPSVQIFATDIDEQMLQIARDASYPIAAMADIPMPLREMYTIPHADRFTMAGEIRDMVRFSSHSIVKDPPFSRLDLISCRNVLIYFGERLQQSVMPLLHYALRPGGYLFLGPSESVGRFEHLFPAVDHHVRLFQRSAGPAVYPMDLPGGSEPPVRAVPGESPRRRATLPSDEGPAVRQIIDRYAPPALVVDPEGGIVAAYGKLGRYFDFPVTRAGGSSAISLARPGLRNALGRLLREVRTSGRQSIVKGVSVRAEFGTQEADLICDPLRDGTFLVVLRETAPFRHESETQADELETNGDHLGDLEEELRVTRHRLRSAVEELETANEELKSSNEEMMSMNEELQSTNEELTTVNDELKTKVDQLTIANSDLRNFFDSTHLAAIVLDDALRIRSYTEATGALFPLQPGDRGRPLDEVASRLATGEYLDDARAVANGHAPIQRRVTSRDGERTYLMRSEPYIASSGGTEGATLVFADITDELSLERELAEERERLSLAIRAGRIAVWEYRVDTGEATLDATGHELFGVTDEGGRRLEEFMDRILPADRQVVLDALDRATRDGADFEASFRVDAGVEGIRRLKAFAKALDAAQSRRLIGVSIDVTAEYKTAEIRELMLREMNHRVKNLFAVIGGLISAGARSHDDVGVFADDMRNRIAALGRAHSLASPTAEQQAIALARLIEATLEPYRHQADLELAGPELAIDQRCLSPMALILHEWATNSIKYGALSVAAGSIRIDWRREARGVMLLWTERVGQPVELNAHRGFGSLLVETSLRQLDARLERQVRADTFELRLHLPDAVFADG